MLPARNRLKLYREVEAVKSEGVAKNSKNFVVLSKKSTRPESRFAFVVSTNVSKKAVARNRIRRASRDAVRALLPTMAVKRDFLIIARPSAVGVDRKTLMSELAVLLSRA